jgi:uncharacterized damage-inducible protein DinB
MQGGREMAVGQSKEMAISQSLLPEIDHEIISTRKHLERVPEQKFAWKPHEKSMAMGGLATHIANIPTWVGHTLNKDEMDMAPPGAPPHKMEQAASRKELLESFEKNMAEARAVIAGSSDEQFFMNWSLLVGGKRLFTMPKIAVLRGFVFNHLYHHRAQLGVYLRLNNIPVPETYGPSADEGKM